KPNGWTTRPKLLQFFHDLSVVHHSLGDSSTKGQAISTFGISRAGCQALKSVRYQIRRYHSCEHFLVLSLRHRKKRKPDCEQAPQYRFPEFAAPHSFWPATRENCGGPYFHPLLAIDR